MPKLYWLLTFLKMQSSYKKLMLGFILQMFLFRENSENQIEKADDLLQKV